MTDQKRPRTRHRRTRAELATLDDQIVSVLASDHPQSVRHVFYRMTDPRLAVAVDKTQEGYNLVQRRLKLLRRTGRVPYGWLSDMTRTGFFTRTYASGGDYLRAMAAAYRADLWADADVHVEVWVESRSIAGVLLDLCDELAVSLYPTGGFTSITFAHAAAEYINRMVDRPVVILYVGDYDPAGMLIPERLEDELRRHLDEGVALEFYRLGINADQIAEHGLPTRPRKASERRLPGLTETVEAEAMPAHVLRELLRAEVESYLPPQALAVAKVAEASERQALRKLAALCNLTGTDGLVAAFTEAGGDER